MTQTAYGLSKVFCQICIPEGLRPLSGRVALVSELSYEGNIPNAPADLGGNVTRRDPPKSEFLSNLAPQNQAAIATLRAFHARIEAKPAKLKKDESTSDARLSSEHSGQKACMYS